MKRLLKGTLILACTALMMAGCAKDEQVQGLQGIGDQTVTFSVGLENAATKAAADNDGMADSVNRWIMEVRDNDGGLFNRQVKDGTIGQKTNSFSVRLVKGQTYNVLFWADYNGGYYDADDLTDVKLADASTYTANLDSRDAFSAVEKGFSITATTQKNVYLKRPFGQLNVIFKDLDTLYKAIGNETEYAKFKPKNFQVVANVPTSFNVYSQTAGDQAQVIIKADKDYKDNYNTHLEAATLFMDYMFASGTTKDILDINFRFDSKDGVTIEHDFTAIPFQRNYRTNISGDLMTAGATWDVTVVPDWTTPDFDVPYMETNSISTAKSYIAPDTPDSQEAKVIKISEGAVTADDVEQNPVEGLKVVQFVLNSNSPKEVSFVLPAVGDNADAWYVTYSGTYPTENVAIDAPAGTKVIVNAKTSHVKVTGTNYATIISSTDDNTLEIPAGCTVDNLVVKEGGLEIHGTVNQVSVEGTTENVFVRACEGLSESVYTVLKDYIAKGYEAVELETTPVTYNIVLTSVNWADYAAKSFSQIDESAKTINILSEAEFALFANNVNAGTTYEEWTITLGNALDMSGHKWTPIGSFTDGTQFQGTFDGKNLAIDGLDVYTSGKKGNGVFGHVYAPCVLKNIKVINATVTAVAETDKPNTYTGGLVGHGYATIENCSFQGTVNGGNQMGGIAASGGFTIRNCTFDGTINGKYWGIGGIVGNCQDGGEISGNTAKGSIVGVLADSTDPFIGGGIIGCAIYTSYDVKSNYSGMQISYNGKPQTGFPVVGVYNIDAPGSGNEDFSNLLTTLADNTWDKSIFTGDEYEIYYNNNAPLPAGYMLNYGAATTVIYVATVGDTAYQSLDEALAAVSSSADKTVRIIRAGEYAVQQLCASNCTIEASVDGVIFNHTPGYGQWITNEDCSTVTVKNITWNVGNDSYQMMYASLDSCTVNGMFNTGAAQTFKNCDFVNHEGYNMWVYGTDATFEGCTFTCPGKNDGVSGCGSAINVYNEGSMGGVTHTLVVKDCTFTAENSSDKYPAIYIKPEVSYDVTITNSTANDNFFTNAISGSKVWGLKNNDNKTHTVTVDGKLVYANGELL